jgi:hypothetical protein
MKTRIKSTNADVLTRAPSLARKKTNLQVHACDPELVREGAIGSAVHHIATIMQIRVNSKRHDPQRKR